MPTISKESIVDGRVDHGEGVVLGSQKAPNPLFHSLLLCVGTNFNGSLGFA